jgi:cell division protein FtsI (penicillin-binding protein 3)
MQVAAAYAALASGGVYHRPTLVARPGAGERVVREPTARTVVRMLEQAVEGETGTGKRARVAGVRLAGKTGTADLTEPGGKSSLYASFVGIVPSDRPRFVILVGAEVAGRDDATGGALAAPAFARLAARALAR